MENVESESVEILADPERMGQVLGNLLDNAIRHSSPGSAVIVSCRQLHHQFMEFAVADSGEGISAQHLGHIYDRFYRADSARNRSQGEAASA